MGFAISSTPKEHEATLLIHFRQAGEVGLEIAAMEQLAGYRLLARPQVVLKDTYWDLPDGSLGHRKIALRLRREDDSALIALKGRAENVHSGGVRRVEIEEPWSEQALDRLVEALGEMGVVIAQPLGRVHENDPEQALRDHGLVPIQQRETTRIPRDVVPKEGRSAIPIAELVIDSTVFQVADDTRVVHEELEIEAKAPQGAQAIETILRDLKSRFGNAVQPWDHGKLATGMALIDLVKAGDLRGLVDAGHRLSPKGYRSLDATLSNP